jgi:hypothetical protein
MIHPEWVMVHPCMDYLALGIIPTFLDLNDPRPAREQFDERYISGWRPSKSEWQFDRETLTLQYPEDPPLSPLAYTLLRDELIVFYPHEFVMIASPGRPIEVMRMD